MKNSETKTCLQVEGVMLTEELLEMLKRYQDNNNEELKMEKESIADAVCYLAYLMVGFISDDEIKKASEIIGNLSSVREHLDDLKKP